MTPHCLTTCFPRLPMMILALLALALQGCGDGVRILPSDADPSGYYNRDGHADVDDGASGTRKIENLQALVNGDRIMMMSTAEGLLYDGTITSINGDDFTADFTIYTDGDNPIDAKASGTITTGSLITGTLTGNGVGSGIFTLQYASTNDDMADISRIENVVGVNETWQALIGGAIIEQEFVVNNEGVITHDTISGGGIFSNCDLNGKITPISRSSLYNVNVRLMDCSSGGGGANGTYTGLATSRTDSSQDDVLLFAVANGRYSPNADFQ
ncbi:hypothetical protein MNBD_GAMMA18-1218 [hydrothermal vent metagenome]|uniref:Uncharacterized protein n=1 Tax=hydrothermal vent metagenome TaxID=652676 RepID=A0A3B0YUP9_9ZZZZ